MKRMEALIRENPFQILEQAEAAVLFTDLDKNILYSNPSFQKIFHVNREDIRLSHGICPPCTKAYIRDNLPDELQDD